MSTSWHAGRPALGKVRWMHPATSQPGGRQRSAADSAATVTPVGRRARTVRRLAVGRFHAMRGGVQQSGGPSAGRRLWPAWVQLVQHPTQTPVVTAHLPLSDGRWCARSRSDSDVCFAECEVKVKLDEASPSVAAKLALRVAR